MNLPNKLTVLRVVMVPFFVFFILTDAGGSANKWIALVIFCVASLTDMLDGKMFSLNESIMKISGEQSGAENRPDERRPDKWTGLLTGGAQEEAPGGLEGSAGDCIAERDTAQEALKEQDPDGV